MEASLVAVFSGTRNEDAKSMHESENAKEITLTEAKVQKLCDLLDEEFKWEICGNYSYWGRNAFDSHFTIWRHQHGMRFLGIPYTKTFNTSNEEAKEFWKRRHERPEL